MREAIPVYGHASSADGAKQLIDAGYRAFKCSPSARTLEELRSAVGWEVEIGVHCHGQFSPASAIQLGKAIEPFRPAFFEDPVIPEDIEAIAKVAEKVNVPIATGERFATKWAFTELLSRKLVDLVQPETTRLGGITELKKLAAMAEAHSVKVAPHDGSVGPIVEMANVHVLASIPNCYFLEHKIKDVPWRYEVAPGAVQESGGEIRLPDAPGLGVDVDEAVALAHQARAASDFEHRHSAPEDTTRLDTQW